MAAIGSIESNHDNNDTQDHCLPGCAQLESGQKRTLGRQVLAKELRRGPKIDVRSVARKINISALDISPGQLYAQLVSNICSLLSLCQ
jgi:hypothetical protein